MKTKTAMILAAGYGKRLMPITSKIPKPMIEIYNKPLLGYAIDILVSIGIKKIFVNTHYKKNIINNYIISKYKNLDINQIYEPNLLDTGGAVKNACKFFKEKFILVLNSDTFWNSATKKDLLNILNYSDYNNSKCLLLLSRINNTYGLKINSGDFKIIKKNILRNKCKNEGLVYTGAQIIDTDVFDLFNDEVFSFNKVWDFLIKKKEITAVLTKSNILHLGNINGFSYLNTFNT